MPTDITTHKLPVTRTARYATCGAEAAEAAHLWVVLHGYGERAADFISPFAEAAPANTRVVAPEGLSRFYLALPRPDGGHLTHTGATWLTRDDRDDDLRDALGMLHAVVRQELEAIQVARGHTPALHLLGFSQGVAMSMRWAVACADGSSPMPLLHTHVLWAGGLAHDVPDADMIRAWEHSAVHLVVGDRDRFASNVFRDSIHERLARIGRPITAHAFTGGHRLDTPLLRSLLAGVTA